MNRNTTRRLLIGSAIAACAFAVYFFGYVNGGGSVNSLMTSAHASAGGTVQEGWSPTGVYPHQEVYYPGTEELGEDEIRVIACGSGMPMPQGSCSAR